uniref:BAI1-associated protein 3-like isoform X2 n=1 Tax=Myxine glutinosa TaxID=7769 RepID=UPI00358FC451
MGRKPLTDSEINEYVQQVFQKSDAEQEETWSRVRSHIPPVVQLWVSVNEARNLMAKDFNGLSDPYCTLRVVEGDDHCDDHSNLSSDARHSIDSSNITKVQFSTLDPVWNEQFILIVKNPQTTFFHLCVWDHDEELSFTETFGSLSKVSGLQGVKRYFKDAVRTAFEEMSDDFLGYTCVSIKDIPLHGLDAWFKLTSHSGSPKGRGECHLRLRLSMSGRFGTFYGDPATSHRNLLSTFVKHELENQKESTEWDGHLPAVAHLILLQHACQNGLTFPQQSLIRWNVYSHEVKDQNLPYSLLMPILCDLENSDPQLLQEEKFASEGFCAFREGCSQSLVDLRSRYPANALKTPKRLESFLRCLVLVLKSKRMNIFLQEDTNTFVVRPIQEGNIIWFNETNTQVKEKESHDLSSLLTLIEAVTVDLKNCSNYYGPLFKRIVDVDIFTTSFCQFEPLIAVLTQSTLSDTLGDSTTMQKSDNVEEVAEEAFQLYKSLQSFVQLKSYLTTNQAPSEQALSGFHCYFEPLLTHWCFRAYQRTHEWINKAVDIDTLREIDELVSHSCSSVDVTTCLRQFASFSKELDWPEPETAYSCLFRILNDICNETVSYVNKLQDKILHMEEENGIIIRQMCVVVNNINIIERFLNNLLKDLNWDNLAPYLEVMSGEERRKDAEQALQVRLDSATEELQIQEQKCLAMIPVKMEKELKDLLCAMTLASSAAPHDDAISPLMQFIESNLAVLHRLLSQEHFKRVLFELWSITLRVLRSCMSEELVGNPDCCAHCLNALKESFHAGGTGLLLEDIKNETFFEMEKELQLIQKPTTELIELYFQRRTEEQKTIEKGNFGTLMVKAYYDEDANELVVEVIHATNIIALDDNGYSDPFVKVELYPNHKFPESKVCSTKTKYKTLHPIYDETFRFELGPENWTQKCHEPEVFVLFSVYDYNILFSNEFVGEAILGLSNVRDGVLNSSTPVQLHLTCVSDEDCFIFHTLKGRLDDKDAQEFVSKRNVVAVKARTK